MVAAAFVALELLATLPFAFIESRELVGFEGSIAVLVAVTAAVVRSARFGVLVATLGGAFLLAFTLHEGASVALRYAASVPVWMLVAYVAGRTAERSRRRTALALTELAVKAAEAEEARAAVERVLAQVPELGRDGPPGAVAETVCAAALDAFGADAASVWDHDEDGFTLLARVPYSPTLPVGSRVAADAFRDFEADLALGRPSFVADVESSYPQLWNDAARASGTRAALRVPLGSSPSRRALMLSWREPVEGPSRALMASARRFGDQAALALEGAARRELEAETAVLHARLQQGLLPRVALRSATPAVTTRYLPGEDRLLLGGDFYDVVELPDGTVAALVGDVAGHGPDAAAVGASLRASWRALTLARLDGPSLLRTLDEMLVRARRSAELFVTVCAVSLATGGRRATVLRAGHPAPILVGPAGARPLDVPVGPPLGVVDQPAWAAADVLLPPEWSLLLYTDGLFEGRAAPGSAERFGVERVVEVLDRVDGLPDGRAVDTLLDEVRAANGAPVADDIAVVLLTRAQPAA